jgi:hypothetical protein
MGSPLNVILAFGWSPALASLLVVAVLALAAWPSVPTSGPSPCCPAPYGDPTNMGCLMPGFLASDSPCTGHQVLFPTGLVPGPLAEKGGTWEARLGQSFLAYFTLNFHLQY